MKLFYCFLLFIPSIFGSSFNLVWNYTFTSTLSWSFNVYQGNFASCSNAYFLKSNAIVSADADGTGNTLALWIRNETTNGRPYSCAGVSAWGPPYGSHQQIYGRWVVKAKFPSGFGTTGYIGLFPTDKSWPPEVDFAEVIGKSPTKMYLTQHYGSNNIQVGTTYVSSSNTDWTNDYHIYSLEWTPSSLSYYIDGVNVLNQTVNFNATYMDLAIGTGTGDCGSWADCPSNAQANGKSYGLPSAMLVKFVQIYSYSP